jgi:hypothetical protein
MTSTRTGYYKAVSRFQGQKNYCGNLSPKHTDSREVAISFGIRTQCKALQPQKSEASYLVLHTF